MKETKDVHQSDQYIVKPIGFIKTCFPEKFGIPRQPLLAPAAKGIIELVPPFNDPDSVVGLENCSHLWLTFIFHKHYQKAWKAKVRPPRLGGNQKTGVFATRSSFRPNNLGLSVVKLDSVFIEGSKVSLFVSGVDILDDTPIVDIKPYVPYADCVNSASNNLAIREPDLVEVVLSQSVKQFCSVYYKQKSIDISLLIIQILQQDPRPAYHQKTIAEHQYGMALLDCNVVWHWKMNEENVETIFVTNIDYIKSA